MGKEEVERMERGSEFEGCIRVERVITNFLCPVSLAPYLSIYLPFPHGLSASKHLKRLSII